LVNYLERCLLFRASLQFLPVREKVFNRKLSPIVNFNEELSDFLDVLDDDYDSLDENLEQLLVDYLERC